MKPDGIFVRLLTISARFSFLPMPKIYALNGPAIKENQMLSVCTFTGIDATTDLSRVIAMSKRYPFLEFGILFSFSHSEKDSRYMSPEMVDDVLENLSRAEVQTALHVCGSAVSAYIEGDAAVRRPALLADRVQLNFSFDKIGYSIENIDKAISSAPYKIITQHFEKNTDVTTGLKARNHQVLFDASHGRGVEVELWPAPIAGKSCGYAGGLGPDNIKREIAKINAVNGRMNSWLDMETKLRPGGFLDLDICEYIAASIADCMSVDPELRRVIFG
jgi:phosphoribosylanthranilate isomerase